MTETLPVLAEEELTSGQMCIQTHRRVHVGSMFMLENNPQVSVSNNGLVFQERKDGRPASQSSESGWPVRSPCPTRP